MPLVHVQTYAGRTIEQKTECARSIVKAIQEHLGTPPESVQIIFSDVDKADWFTGNKLPPPAPPAKK